MAEIKEEIIGEYLSNSSKPKPSSAPSLAAAWKPPIDLINLSSSDSGSNSDSDSGDSSCPDEDGAWGGTHRRPKKKKKVESSQGTVALPLGFLDPLPLKEARLPLPATAPAPLAVRVPGELALAMPAPGARGTAIVRTEYSSRQFWKAGDYEGAPSGDWESARMDHVRVHPRFLHSNATSHTWVLGAFAELLDNALDEVCDGATFVSIDMITNKKDESRILVIEDNGGGMDPDKIRQCMSLGYSAKSKIADTIGQYGNGFKTSTMRLGADVIVFSCSCGQDGNRPTQSVGLLSYTFLRETGKEDIVVPMLDFERKGRNWSKAVRSSDTDWNRTVDTIVQWSPFSSEADLLEQFNQIEDHGTRIFIYNLWEDDEGLLELDFDADPRDIQIRGVNRDEKNIQMAQQYPNSRHFLTYRHSLRSYAAILYLRVPSGFRIILRGKDVEHHNIVNDMMMTQEVTYRPQSGADGVLRDSNMVAVVTVGFVKDAKAHIDVQGFNVYHKNRLIKPFWRVWHPPGSDGRGVIGLLEANFVQPAHDKQGFERTIVLSRLEAKLIQMQKTYWSTHCHKIGYAPRRNKKLIDQREVSTDRPFQTPKSSKSTELNGKTPVSEKKFSLRSKLARESKEEEKEKGNIGSTAFGRRLKYSEQSSPSVEDVSDDDEPSNIDDNHENACSTKSLPSKILHRQDSSQIVRSSPLSRFCVTGKKGSEGGKPVGGVDSEVDDVGNESSSSLQQLKEENRLLRERLKRKEQEFLGDLLGDLEQERNKRKLLEGQVSKLSSHLQEANAKIQEQSKEQESLIKLFAEERGRHETEEEHLRNKLKDASNTIQDLLDKVRRTE